MKQKRIGDIKVGDMIMTERGPEAVTEVITRKNRKMYRVTFADGRELKLSEDHPLHVAGKGYAALNNEWDYKDLGRVPLLVVGDMVTNQDGTHTEVVAIYDLNYPETVYTFGNSGFYANGFLVY